VNDDILAAETVRTLGQLASGVGSVWNRLTPSSVSKVARAGMELGLSASGTSASRLPGAGTLSVMDENGSCMALCVQRATEADRYGRQSECPVAQHIRESWSGLTVSPSSRVAVR